MLSHRHLILKGVIARPVSAISIENSLHEITSLVCMKVLYPARVVYCNEPDNVGYTGGIYLTTSHMMWHDWNREDDKLSDFQFDLYSCADFYPYTVVNYLERQHGLKNYVWKLFDRDYDIIETGRGFSYS